MSPRDLSHSSFTLAALVLSSGIALAHAAIAVLLLEAALGGVHLDGIARYPPSVSVGPGVHASHSSLLSRGCPRACVHITWGTPSCSQMKFTMLLLREFAAYYLSAYLFSTVGHSAMSFPFMFTFIG